MPILGTKLLLLIFTSAEILFLLFQIFNYLSRKQDKSRLRFMLLIIGFLIFNLANLSSPNIFGLSLLLSKIITYSSGVLLAAGYLIYILKEFDIIDQKVDTKSLVWILAITLCLGYLTSNFVLGTSDVARNVLIVLPIVISTTFCCYLQFQFIKKIDLYRSRLHFKLMLYTSYLGLVIMSSIPLFINIGKYNFNLSVINIVFLSSITIHIHQLFTESKKAFQSLDKIGDFSNEDIFSNYNLTKREKELAYLFLTDLTFAEIGDRIFIAEGTVSRHATNIYRKTGCQSRSEFREKFILRKDTTF